MGKNLYLLGSHLHNHPIARLLSVVKAGLILNCGKRQLVLPGHQHLKEKKMQIRELILKQNKTTKQKAPLKPI